MAKILVLGKFYPPFSGGIEVSTRDISEGLAKEHDVRVYCFNHQPHHKVEVINGVEVNRFGVFKSFQSQPLSFYMAWKILTSKADIFHLHAPNFLASTVLYIKLVLFRYKARVIVTHHTDVFGRQALKYLLLPLYREVLRRASFVVVTSKKLIDISTDLIPGVEYRVIPLGVSPDVFHVSPDADNGQDAAAVPAGKRPVGFLGRHVRYKGLSVLINALSLLDKTNALIAGDGPVRHEAESQAKKLGIYSRTQFLGDVRDLEKKIAFYKTIGVFVFPSTEVTETFGVAQLEAMLLGVPVIASDLHTGVTDVSIHEETALLVPPGDAEALAKAITRLNGDPELRQRLIKNARQRVLTHFTNDIAIKSTMEMFAEALAKPSDNGA